MSPQSVRGRDFMIHSLSSIATLSNPRSKQRRHILALAARRSTRQPGVTTEHSNAMETSDDIIAVDHNVNFQSAMCESPSLYCIIL